MSISFMGNASKHGSRMSRIEFEQTFGKLARAENPQMFSIYTVYIKQTSETENSGNAQTEREIVKWRKICLLS